MERTCYAFMLLLHIACILYKTITLNFLNLCTSTLFKLFTINNKKSRKNSTHMGVSKGEGGGR